MTYKALNKDPERRGKFPLQAMNACLIAQLRVGRCFVKVHVRTFRML